ncbi:MAG: hypothetical protein KDD11_08415 [Acidobacteria bacterium]|nr:hypothetical protein [Acidobacteriota bacterium]
MTTPATYGQDIPAPPPPPSLWRAQLAGVVRLEARKTLLGSRVLPLLLLAGLPLGLLLLLAIVPLPSEIRQGIDGVALFAGIYRVFFLRIAIFVGCLVVFIQLFRGDLMERSLHYYFLCPIRRELLMAGKFLVGLASTGVILGISTAGSYVLAVLPFAAGRPGFGDLLGQAVAYTATTLLGCLGYGALFMLAGLYVRNPVVPAMALFLWELLNPFLFSLLRKISVIYYLQSMLPVHLSEGPFAILSDLVSPWLAVPGLLLVAGLALALSAWRIRNLEITYANE